MIRNFLKIAVRNIQRYPSYTLINTVGLALGMSCVVLIFSMVSHHLSFDNFHHNSDRIYRFVTEQHRDEISYVHSVPNPFGKTFREDYSLGEKVGRICTFNQQLITIENQGEVRKFKEAEAAFAETEFFEIFNFPLKHGDIKKALHEPNQAILTERMAKKYFGDENPLDKTFRLDGRIDFKVTGILKDLPKNSDRNTEIYLSYSTLKQYSEWLGSDDSWGGISTSMQCFVLLKPGVTPDEVEKVLPAYVKKYRATSKNVHHYKLQPLHDIHFNAHYGGAMEKRNLWVLSFIGFFLIITACVNFINLATSQAIRRSKEVGIRKVLGSMRKQLFWQFIIETGGITLLALMLALSISITVLPYVNEWFESQMQINIFSDWRMLVFIPALILFVAFAAGSYPGLILSGFQPVVALKGKLSNHQTGNFNIRRTLIVMQFAISQVLIIGLIVINYQLHYAKQADLGFDKEAVVMIPVGSYDEKMSTLKSQFSQMPGVEQISLCFSAPASTEMWRTSLRYDNHTEEEVFSVSSRVADEQYLSTFGLKLVAGRNLFQSDTVREFLVNEAFVRKLNLASPEEVLGKSIAINAGKWKAPIVGVIRDFHDLSFHEDINPVFIGSEKEEYNFYAVKINTADIRNTLAALDKTWSEMYPEQLYEYNFVDDHIAEFYKTEDTMTKLIQVFSGIAIFIGCMGLFGLVSFMATQKTKEIGIRKVLGSTISQILWIFGKEFSVLITVAFILAAPFGWWIMDRWLQDFKYRIELTPWIFVLAIGITSLIALITVSFQSIKAALMNPVNALKTE